MRHLLRTGSALASAALALVPATAFAQSDDDKGIVVTAERRAESVQDIPVSIVALSGETLRERGVETLGDLTKEVPSLSFVDNGLSKFINIRGVGLTESAPYTTVGVAVHLDGTYIVRDITYADAFFDVESIQVLRGPQGTYSGLNANGGAIFIESAKPVLGEVTGYARAEMGNYSKRQLESAVSIPLGATLAARFSGKFERRGMFGESILPNGVVPTLYKPAQLGDRSNYAGRAQLLWEPSANLQARLIHQYSNLHSGGDPPQKGVPEDYADPRLFTRNPSPYDRQNLEIARTTGVIRWDPVDAFRVNANLAYQTTHLFQGGDQDRTPIRQRQGFNTINDKYWTGEINLVSRTDGPLSWTAGANFVDYKQVGDAYSERSPTQIASATGRNFLLDTARQNYAIFGEMGYSLTDTLEVRVGARYNWDKTGFNKFLSFPSDGLNPNAPFVAFPANGQFVNFEQATGRVLVNWKPDPDHLFYLTISRGYKPGGLTALAQKYGSEVVTNYEAGWKGSLLDGAVNGSVSAFYMQYDGYQISVQPDPTDPTTSLTANIDDTTIQGVEAQLTTRVGGLNADVAMSYLDTDFGPAMTTLPAGAYGNPTPIGIDVGGRRVPYAAKWTVNGGLAYDIPLGAGHLTPSARVSYVSDQYVTFFLLPYHKIEARTLVDVRLAYAPNDNLTISAFARNLFDEQYSSNRSQTTDGVGEFTMGAPRTYGLSVETKF